MRKIIPIILLASIAFAAKDTISFAAVGDIMMGLNYPNNNPILPPQDGELTFASVKEVLKNADITIGNLEGVLLDSGGYAKQCSNPMCAMFLECRRNMRGFWLMPVLTL